MPAMANGRCVLMICLLLNVLLLCYAFARTVWANNFWLQLDYLQLANAALNVSCYFTCLLYVEVWADITRSVLACFL